MVRLAFVGLDNTGKTSIAKELAKQLKVPYFKDIAYKENFFGSTEYVVHSNTMLLELMGAGAVKSIILDRFVLDELVYGKAYDRDSNYQIIGQLVKDFIHYGTRIVYCHKQKYLVDDKVPITIQRSVNKYYNEWFNAQVTDYIALDTTDENLEKQLQTIIKWL